MSNCPSANSFTDSRPLYQLAQVKIDSFRTTHTWRDHTLSLVFGIPRSEKIHFMLQRPAKPGMVYLIWLAEPLAERIFHMA